MSLGLEEEKEFVNTAMSYTWVEPGYDRCWPTQLTASTLNQLASYVSSPLLHITHFFLEFTQVGETKNSRTFEIFSVTHFVQCLAL